MVSTDKDQKEKNAIVTTSAQSSGPVDASTMRLSVSEQLHVPDPALDHHAADGQASKPDASDLNAAEQHASDGAADLNGDRHIYGHLGRKLKESYDDLVRQPVPDKFRKLLEELERKEKGQ